MIDEENLIHKYFASFSSSKDQGDVSSEPEYDSAKRTVRCHKNIILDLLVTVVDTIQGVYGPPPPNLTLTCSK